MSIKSIAVGLAAAPLFVLCSFALAADTIAEADIKFDNLTSAHKALIVAGLNKLAHDNKECEKIDTQSVQYDFANASPDNPAFTVQCGEGDHKTTQHFSLLDVGG